MASNTYNIKIASVPTKGRAKTENGVPLYSGGGSNSLLIVNEDIKNLFNEFFEKDGDLIKVKKELYCVGGITAFGDGTVKGSSDSGSGAIATLSDVILTDPSKGETLIYNGTHWVNSDENSVFKAKTDSNGIIVETPQDYLLRVKLEQRFIGLNVTLIENIGDTSYVTYCFKSGIENYDFIPVKYFVNIEDYIVDNLTTDDPKKALSANQGKKLKDMIDNNDHGTY